MKLQKCTEKITIEAKIVVATVIENSKTVPFIMRWSREYIRNLIGGHRSYEVGHITLVQELTSLPLMPFLCLVPLIINTFLFCLKNTEQQEVKAVIPCSQRLNFGPANGEFRRPNMSVLASIRRVTVPNFQKVRIILRLKFTNLNFCLPTIYINRHTRKKPETLCSTHKINQQETMVKALTYDNLDHKIKLKV